MDERYFLKTDDFGFKFAAIMNFSACCLAEVFLDVDLEERLRLLNRQKTGSSVYSQVRHYIDRKSGKVPAADISGHLPWLGRSSITKALKTLTEEGFIERRGVRKGTFYTKKEMNSND